MVELGVKSDSLKEMEEKAIMSFLGGSDTFVSLPTGYGKSLIYALLPVAFNRMRGVLLLYRYIIIIRILAW